MLSLWTLVWNAPDSFGSYRRNALGRGVFGMTLAQDPSHGPSDRAEVDGARGVYARKSTEQNVADDEKSVRRQIDLAVVCARENGFTVPAEHIYVDDAISGAEFDRRPGLMRLLNTIGRRAPFAALFLADKDRL